jgi:DNA helicase-2/ATP-dependent DNA helicase PcrA
MTSLQKKFVEIFDLASDNEKQKAIFETDGPTLIIAGPGTGKTYTLVLRTLYLILSGKAKPSEIVLTTFTEKSAYELRDRLSLFSKKLGIKINLHELITGTIHGICDKFNNIYIKQTPLNKNYIVLDDLICSLFINEHFDDIIEPYHDGERYFGRWRGKWDTISRVKVFYDKITEEIIDPDDLIDSDDQFLVKLGESYKHYSQLMFENNRVDFSFQQRIFYDLLQSKTTRDKIAGKIKYMLIDEYQDTNYIQEQIALTLVKPHNNITVVGDEDQALYRFRGATVRNILEFETHFSKCKKIRLLENFRSHKEIIEHYNAFMEQVDWSNPMSRLQFRYPDKEVIPAKSTLSPDYPAVFNIWTDTPRGEAERFADMVEYLLKNKVINDPSDVALLLRSVKLDYSEPFIEALNKKNIKAFCPRAKAYFENEEIKILIACYALIFEFIGDELDEYSHKDVIIEGIQLLGKYVSKPLGSYIRLMNDKINALNGSESIDELPSDIPYQLFAFLPFSDYLKDENAARNLSKFSALINSFMMYYHIPVISAKNKKTVKYNLFNSFFNLLFNSGQNEYEDQNNPIPKGYVQIMTIHQSKGLEFPVVVVSSLDKQYSVNKQTDHYLSDFYKRPVFEPENRITQFDHARLFYVAFSRPQKILVLSSSKEPKDIFAPVWEGNDQWPHVKKETLKAQRFQTKAPYIPKKSLSLTSHVNIYETCPRQYLFYKEYEFTPSRSGQLLFGTLVHETIEDLHRRVLEGEVVSEKIIADDFENNYKGLIANGYRPLGVQPKQGALSHCLNYFQNNKELLKRVIETEIDVSYEKDDYIINGKVDLLLGKDDKLEVLDFKTQPRPAKLDAIMEKYRYQLHVYAHIIKERYQKNPERLYIYWTAEDNRKDAFMEIDYDEKLVEAAGKHFDAVAKCIINKDFEIKNKPDKTKVCKECDFKHFCKMNIE